MQQFSKLKPKDEFKEPKDQVLFDNDYVKVIDYEANKRHKRY